jgi:endonuclease/exonuclease/phosphatase family metal-dependent hydrolase
MRPLRVVTWNVLHRVHAVNWSEDPVATFPDERVRIAGITDTIVGWLANGVDAVCLQEVSGDQLASLRAALAGGVHVFEHTYPRVPRLRGGGEPVLDDPSEHLVVATTSAGARLRDACTFDSDPGKGLLAVDLGGDVALVDTHVSFGDRRGAQLATVARTARSATGGAIVVGDFNARADVVRAGLGGEVAITELSGRRPTRVPTADHPAGQTIDHVVVLGGAIVAAEVLDGRGLSDHEPVSADVR